MKIFSIHLVRNVLALFIALGLGYVAYTVSPTTVIPTKVEAGASQNVSGWAYNLGTQVNTTVGVDQSVGPYNGIIGNSSGLGWISLNGNDCTNNGTIYLGTPIGCPANGTPFKDYGVNISPLSGTGIFSGYAWSENIGWISFERATTGTPPSAPFNTPTGHIAQVDWETGNVTGWARALSGCEMIAGTPATTCVPTPGTGAGAASGGWDGWIKLAGMTTEATPQPYGVKIDLGTKKFLGKAWGSDVIGWIDFAPVNTTTGLPVNTSTQIAPPVCSAGDTTSYTYTGQPCVASCVSGGSSSQTVSGTQYASCLDGNPAPPTSQTCGPVALTCSNTTTPTMWFKGDTVCNTALGENSTNSLSDCKPKTKFWQF